MLPAVSVSVWRACVRYMVGLCVPSLACGAEVPPPASAPTNLGQLMVVKHRLYSCNTETSTHQQQHQQ